MWTGKQLPPLILGQSRIDPPLLLAPMAGYTDSAMRSICLEKGACLAYSEVVQAAAVARKIPVIMHSLSVREGEYPLVGHIYGRNPEEMAEAARIMARTGNFIAIDINCGCPVRKIVAKGAGAALMREPSRIGRIVESVKLAVDLPVTVKTRLGLASDGDNVEEVARTAESAGADAIAVHARYAADQHRGEADWDSFKRVKAAVEIPVIGNGGIESSRDADEMLRRGGVDAVMVGRGAIGNPWIFKEIRSHWNGRPYSSPSVEEQMDVIRTHLERLTEYIAEQQKLRRRASNPPERTACLKFRGHLVRYLGGRRGVKELMRRIDGIYTVDGLMNAVKPMFS